MKKFLKIFLCVVIASIFSFAFFACYDNDLYEIKYNKDGKKILTVWAAYPLYPAYKSNLSPSSMKYSVSMFTKRVVEKFEADNPDYVVQLVDKGWGEALNQSIQQGSLANELPDLLAGETYIQKYIDLDVISPINLGKDKDNFISESLKPGMKDGNVYAVPFITGSFALYYNETMLINAGIKNEDETAKVPTTWAELLDASQKVKAHYTRPEASSSDKLKGGMLICNAGNLANAFRALTFMGNAGGDFLDQSGNVVFESSENLAAFEMIHELSKTAPANTLSLSEQQQIVNVFMDGKAAFMIESSPYIVTATEEDLSKDGVKKIAALPKKDDSSQAANVLSGNLTFSICKKSPIKEAALKFIQLLYSDEVQIDIFQADGRIPVTKTAIAAVNASENDNVVNIRDKTKIFIDTISNSKLHSVPGFINNASSIWAKFDSFMNTVINANSTKEQIAGSLKETSNYIKNNK